MLGIDEKEKLPYYFFPSHSKSVKKIRQERESVGGGEIERKGKREGERE